MPLILGIYAKNGPLNMALAQPVIDDFVIDGNRHASYRKFPSCWLISVNELPNENNFTEKNGQIALWAGTIFKENSTEGKQGENLLSAFQITEKSKPEILDGAFTAAIFNEAENELLLLNDKFGMRPLFVADVQGHVFFCSEFEPLNLLPNLKLDHDAIAAYFSLGTCLGGSSFRKEIRNLEPATLLRFSGTTKSTTKYWNANIKIDEASSIATHANSISNTLTEVVQSTFAQLSNPICLLSAGADSRLILSCMDKALRAQIPYLTSNLSILKPEEDKDVIGALELAKALNLDQHQVTKMSFAELDFGPDYFDRNRHLRAKKVVGGWHGGEYLGGFCIYAAPISSDLKREDVDAKMRQMLSKKFIRSLNAHPFDLYETEIDKLPTENRDFHFQIQQLARGFFAHIYHGSRGHWLQPWQTIIHGYSPFWDSRFLQKLLQIPFQFVEGYQLYNKIFEIALPELREIPSNSPLTNRSDSFLKKMEGGTEPKFALQPKYLTALEKYRGSRATWKRRQYPRWGFKKQLDDGNSNCTMQFIDFEAWVERFGI